jgi:hypothetical protein
VAAVPNCRDVVHLALSRVAGEVELKAIRRKHNLLG